MLSVVRNAFFLLLSAASLNAQVVAPPSTDIFDKDTVHEIRLTFLQPDWYQQLTTNYDTYPDDTPYIQASLTWGQYQFDGVGVRFKGNSSYRGATTKKKPFRIKLNEFTKGQKIDGMASFGLSNAWNDPSFVREKPYYEVAAAAGLASPRSNFAALYINGEYWGLYILGEIVNGDFLKLHFAKGDDTGNLYKAAEPGANLAYLGANPAAYRYFFSKESNEDADDWSDLIELARVFDQTAVADLPAVLSNLVDVDSFLTALALDNLTVNLDSYVGMAQNYYLYRRPSDRKWMWIPWDPSLAFGALAQGFSVQQMKDLPLEWVRTAGGNSGPSIRPVASKLWQVPEYKQRYRQIYQKLVDQYLIPSQLIGRMNTMRDLIRPWVEKDTQKLVTQAQFDAAMTADATTGGNGLQGGAPALQPFVEGRVASVRSLLAGQTPVTISASPASLFAAQVAGSSLSASQLVGLSLSDSANTATYTAAASTPWITLNTTSGRFPDTLAIATSAANLSTGTYSGAITITVPGASNSPVSIPVVLTVMAAPSIVTTPASLTFNRQGMGGIGPATLSQTLTIASTAGFSEFAVRISDTTCNNFLTVAPVSATTPASIAVTANTNGVTGPCTGRINISAAGLATAVVPVTLTAPSGPGGNTAPAISSVVNGASYSAGPVAPGEMLTIFGSNIGPQNLVTGTAANGQLPTMISGVQVLFDGTPAPLLYARFNQVGALAPFEIAGKTQVQIQIVFNGQSSPAVPAPVTLSAPGIFTTAANGTGQASVINQDNSVNAANALAPKGSIVAIYLTGAGQLTPAGVSGAAGLIDQTIVAPVTVTIGGQDAMITYRGAVPGSVQGLYQINAVVPLGSASGSVPLEVSVGGNAAQSAVSLYVQ